MNMSLCQFAFAAAVCFVSFLGVYGNTSKNVDESEFASVLAPHDISALIRNSLLPVSHRQRREAAVATSAVKIGSCSFLKLQYNGAICGKLLYAPYRNISGTGGKTCRSQIPKYYECQKAVYSACVSDPNAIASYMKNLIAASEMMNFNVTQCDFGGFAKELTPALMPATCDDELKAEYAQCTKSYLPSYTANRGDPKLCLVFSRTSTCIFNAMSSHCHGDVVKASLAQTRSFNTKEMNPFCSVSQGGADVTAIMSGKLVDPPASGASLPTISTMAFSLFVLASVYLY